MLSRTYLVLLTFAFFPLPALPAQDYFVQWNKVQLEGKYKLEPDCGRLPCDELTFEGNVRLSASITEEDGYLQEFSLYIDGTLVPVGLVEKFGSRPGFMLGEIAVKFPALYLPVSLREKISGVSQPYFFVDGLIVRDQSCELAGRWIDLIYWLEREEVEFREGCIDGDWLL